MTNGKLFDAREKLMCESSSSPARWETASLVVAIRAIVTWSPATGDLPGPLAAVAENPGSLLEAFQAATTELTRRGLDADSLVRYGMRNEIAASLLGTLALRSLGIDVSRSARSRGLDIDSWISSLPEARFYPEEEITVDHVIACVAAIVSQLPLVILWIDRAPLEALATLSAPDPRDFEDAASQGTVSLDLCAKYAWLVDRFSTTRKEDWQTSSLHLEYRWLAGQEPPPCTVELMLGREMEQADLDSEIARRAVLGVQFSQPDPETMLAVDMAGYALSLLLKDRCAEAAALFEFAATRRPTDAASRNNLGFCLIPQDARKALRDLEAAAQLGYTPIAINIYNRICCHIILHQERQALSVAEKYWTTREDQAGSATIWTQRSEGNWKLDQTMDPRKSIAELVASIALREGWMDEHAKWRDRAKADQASSRG